ncbi:MAG: LemA family protein [Cyclobacteriaceae bacterium]|nr:MAG: LemA family protein [Cyclobacteriaceae bacterium]
MGKWITIGVLAILAIWIFGSYNGLVSKDEAANGQWANVESQYQRRMDLIPNLVNTVKGYANFEQETLTRVIEARASATSVKIDPTNLTPDKLAQFQQAQDGLSSALSRLLVTVERYPELKANQNFLDLQAQLEGTENRIAVERKRFNDLVNEYNATIRKFPGVVVASIFGFERKGYFEATEGAERAPEVQF